MPDAPRRRGARPACPEEPAPPLTLPVTVQFLIDDGVTTECWESIFDFAPENVAGKFNARASYP